MYSYQNLLEDTQLLKDIGYKVEYIGKTVYGKRIPAFLRGVKPKTLIVGGTHAREYITSKLVVQLAKEYSGDNICFVPMLNIDGVEIVNSRLKKVPQKYRKLISKLLDGIDPKLWKANGRGVDINVNYRADWGKGASNLTYPHFENYVGAFCESEPETVASVKLCQKYKFTTLISYHSKGEVIYAGYGGIENKTHSQMLSNLIGYPVEVAKNSTGGFKDWFIKSGYGDGYTIEVGNDKYLHPLDDEVYLEIYDQNKDICSLLESNKWI